MVCNYLIPLSLNYNKKNKLKDVKNGGVSFNFDSIFKNICFGNVNCH